MIITWLGQSCFKLQSGELVAVIDPFSKEIGLTPPRFRADLVLVTHGHYDHSNVETIGGEPFLISGPGEYEVKGVFVRGIETFHDKTRGEERGMNTVYKITIEDLNILHLGDFGDAFFVKCRIGGDGGKRRQRFKPRAGQDAVADPDRIKPLLFGADGQLDHPADVGAAVRGAHHGVARGNQVTEFESCAHDRAT